jgi:hypothetical protein
LLEQAANNPDDSQIQVNIFINIFWASWACLSTLDPQPIYLKNILIWAPISLILQDQIEKLKNEIGEKKSHIHALEHRIMQSLETSDDPAIRTEMSQVIVAKWC